MVTAAEWGQRVGLARPNFTPYLKRARAKKPERTDPPFRSYGDGRFYIPWEDAMAWMIREKPYWILRLTQNVSNAPNGADTDDRQAGGRACIITIRRATPADSAGVIEVARRWPTEHGSSVVPRDVDGDVDTTGILCHINDPMFCIVVAVDDLTSTVVGYAVGFQSNILGTPSDLTSNHAGRYAHIDELMILDDHRGRGIGTLLVQAFEDWGRELGCKSCTLGGGPAQAFYEKIGYQRRIPGLSSFVKVL